MTQSNQPNQPKQQTPSSKSSDTSTERSSQKTDGSQKPQRAANPGTSGTSPTRANECVSQPWNTVNQAGSYVCNETGRLLRVPASALGPDKKPTIEFSGPHGSPNVTRLSTDPKSPIGELRTTCGSTDIKPQF